MSSPQTTSEVAAVADAIRSRDRFLLVTHENPDGDALGSILALKLALDQLGKDSVMYLYGDAPVPVEYSFMPLAELRRCLPDDWRERVLIAVDCANESRIGPEPEPLEGAPLAIDIDHHHDNTRFGDVNLIVADASSTGEVLRDVIRALDVELTSDLAEPLYIALVTDTGRFQYTNTTPKALRLAAELVDAGADVHAVFQQVYESVEFAKLKLLARALERARVLEGGLIIVSHLLRTDFAEVGAAEPYSEGIIDYLRAVEGAELAVLIREQLNDATRAYKGSLRSSIDELDVSAIARRFGGGGHRQAAGFSTDLPQGEVVERHAPPGEDELGDRLERLRGEIELPIPAASAVKIGGERAYKLARRGVEVAMPVRRSTVHALDVIAYTGETVTLDAHVSSGTYIRSLAIALGGQCVTLRRTDVGPFSVADAVLPEAFTAERLLSDSELLARIAVPDAGPGA